MSKALLAFGLSLTAKQVAEAFGRGAPRDSASAFSLWYHEQLDDDTPDDIATKREKLKLIREQRKKLERENSIGDAAVISRDIVRSGINKVIAQFFGDVDRILLSEMPARLGGLEPPAIKRACGMAIEQLKTEFSAGLQRIIDSPTKIRRKAGRPPSGSPR